MAKYFPVISNLNSILMKKKVFPISFVFTAIILVASHDGHAQNTFPTSGNVGIGTSSPSYDLEIDHVAAHPSTNTSPALKISETFYTNMVNMSPANANYKLFEISQQAIYDTYPFSSTSAPVTLNSTIFMVESNFPGGRIGINTATPQYPLDVAGYTHCGAGLLVDGNTTMNGNHTVFGNIGIGTGPSAQRLNIDGDISFSPNSGWYRHIMTKSNDHGLAIYANSNWANGGGILLNGGNNTGNNPGGVDFIASPVNNGAESAFAFWLSDNQSNWVERLMVMQKDGQVIIGQIPGVSPGDYKLYVQTGILTEKVKVAIAGTGDWSDFVFDEDYHLRPLAEIESFVEEHHHLPEIPSAQQVVDEGINLAEMDARLLQKIEELTLYIIQQQKEIDALKIKLEE